MYVLGWIWGAFDQLCQFHHINETESLTIISTELYTLFNDTNVVGWAFNNQSTDKFQRGVYDGALDVSALLSGKESECYRLCEYIQKIIE